MIRTETGIFQNILWPAHTMTHFPRDHMSTKALPVRKWLFFSMWSSMEFSEVDHAFLSSYGNL